MPHVSLEYLHKMRRRALRRVAVPRTGPLFFRLSTLSVKRPCPCPWALSLGPVCPCRWALSAVSVRAPIIASLAIVSAVRARMNFRAGPVIHIWTEGCDSESAARGPAGLPRRPLRALLAVTRSVRSPWSLKACLCRVPPRLRPRPVRPVGVEGVVRHRLLRCIDAGLRRGRQRRLCVIRTGSVVWASAVAVGASLFAGGSGGDRDCGHFAR